MNSSNIYVKFYSRGYYFPSYISPLMSESNYHNNTIFPENLLVIETKKTLILMNKPVYLNLSTL